MQLTCKIIQSGNHMRIVVGGKITTDDCIGLIEQVMSDPHRDPDSTALIDLLNATYDFRDKTDVIRIAHALEAFQSLLKNNIAIVARKCTLFPSDIFGLHVRKTTNLGIRVFVDIAAAEAFCGEVINEISGKKVSSYLRKTKLETLCNEVRRLLGETLKT
jgi:hypothetical protein